MCWTSNHRHLFKTKRSIELYTSPIIANEWCCAVSCLRISRFQAIQQHTANSSAMPVFFLFARGGFGHGRLSVMKGSPTNSVLDMHNKAWAWKYHGLLWHSLTWVCSFYHLSTSIRPYLFRWRSAQYTQHAQTISNEVRMVRSSRSSFFDMQLFHIKLIIVLKSSSLYEEKIFPRILS